eukprot:scaffold88061_cov60-Phaeocystis_antarctica.AAC.1
MKPRHVGQVVAAAARPAPRRQPPQKCACMHGSTTVSRGCSRQMVQSRASSRSLTRSCRSEHRCVSSPVCAFSAASEARSLRTSSVLCLSVCLSSSSGKLEPPAELESPLDPPRPPRSRRVSPMARSIAARFDSGVACSACATSSIWTASAAAGGATAVSRALGARVSLISCSAMCAGTPNLSTRSVGLISGSTPAPQPSSLSRSRYAPTSSPPRVNKGSSGAFTMPERGAVTG